MIKFLGILAILKSPVLSLTSVVQNFLKENMFQDYKNSPTDGDDKIGEISYV